jgi:formylglycine-generating enzyme required for sulfatase activity
MVVIPAGSFTMGSPKNEKDRYDDEGPQHDVTIAKTFAVGKVEVTVGEFAAFVKATGHDSGNSCYTWNGSKWVEKKGKSWRDPGFKQADDHPVACVSWEDAKAYVAWLAKQTGRDYRLLSEAEWEYTARAETEPGDYTPFHFGNDEADLCDYANGADKSTSFDWRNKSCSDGVGNATAPVASYKPNAFGLYDMVGNVWEWIEDCYHDTYVGSPKDGSAWTSGSCENRALRGGAWISGPRGLLAAKPATNRLGFPNEPSIASGRSSS